MCTCHCASSLRLMNINDVFDTKLRLPPWDFSLQTGGMKAKPQVVSLRRHVLVCDWQQGPHQTSLLHTANWQVEVRKQKAGFSEVQGRSPLKRWGLCVAEPGERGSLEQGLKCWPLASRNPTPL